MPTDTSSGSAPATASLVDFVHTVPAPIVSVLVGLGPAAAALRRGLEIASWRAHWTDSWLLLAAWWAVCLLSAPGLRYALPLFVTTYVAAARWRARKGMPTPPPVAETTLQTAVSDLTTIHALLPRPHVPSSFLPSSDHLSPPSTPTTTTPSTASFPLLPNPTLDARVTDLTVFFRVSGLLTLPYALLTYLVGLRILLGLTGTILLTHRAPWAAHLRTSLWRSAHIRWALYRVWSFLSGQPLPSTLPSSTNSISAQDVKGEDEVDDTAPPLRFLFTLHENQRWWMGLDWTAALLPGERPSWCTPSLAPVSPPAAFSLPPATVSYLPSPSHSDKRVKRTAKWEWAEPEWRVLVRRDGGASARVEKTPPAVQDENSPASSGAVAGSRILKAAGKLRGESGGGAVGQPSAPALAASDSKDADSDTHPGAVDEEPATDADGWVYADNKWEGQAGKGGMGKYTRYRRWTRVAVLSETVELVGPGEVGVVRDGVPAPVRKEEEKGEGAPRRRDEQPAASPMMAAPGSTPASPARASTMAAPSSPAATASSGGGTGKNEERRYSEDLKDAGSALRQRLKAAVKGQSLSLQ